MTIIIEPWLATYLDGVVACKHDAVDIARVSVRYHDGTEPQRSGCHENVDRWVLENTGATAARGWAISAWAGASLMLEAHSVVRSGDGSLIDITLQASDERALFIPHVGDEEAFLAARSRVNQILWPPS